MKLVLSSQSVRKTIAALESPMLARGPEVIFQNFQYLMFGSAAMHTIMYVGTILYEGVSFQ
jgi:hypothetical protein